MSDVTIVETGLDAKQDQSAVSWAAIAAGGIANGALTLVLLAFGSGMGLSAVSPWSNSGISVSTFQNGTGIYLIVAAMLASTVGGYVAGRLRTKWTGLHSEEVLFRDTAHGFLAWCFAVLLGSAVLGASATYLVGGVATGTAQGAAQGASQNAQQAQAGYFTDMLFRPAPNGTGAPTGAQAQSSADTARRSAGLVLARAVASRDDMPSADRAYLAQLVAARAGLPQAEAERRVNDTVQQAKSAADEARRRAAAMALWMAAAMLAGAFSASLAAIEGGQLRDGHWKGVIGTRRYRTAQAR